MSFVCRWQAQVRGSAGCQPAVAGSLPATRLESTFSNDANAFVASRANVLGRLPSTAGWQPALPGWAASR